MRLAAEHRACTPIQQEVLRARLDANGLRQVLFNAPPGQWDAGERGMAALAGREAEFEASIEQGAALRPGAGLPACACDVGQLLRWPDRSGGRHLARQPAPGRQGWPRHRVWMC